MAKTIKGRKFVATAATAALVASAIVPVASASASTEFKDASKISDWAAKAVDFLVTKEVLEGDEAGNFIPQGELTRGQAAKILALTLDLTVDPTASSTFADAKGHWSDAYIAAIVAHNKDIITGFEDGTFRADGKITREQFAKMVVEAFEIELDETKEVAAFTDVSEWATTHVQILASQGIVLGLGGTKFGGSDTLTREQGAVFAHRTLVEEARETVADKATTTATKVESVTATNLKEVTVTFDGTVDAATAQNEENYSTTAGAIQSAALSEDGKTVTLTLDTGVVMENQKAYKVSVSNVKAGDKVLNQKDIAFSPLDNVLPTVSSVKSLGNKAVRVTFSEPVKNVTSSNFKLDEKSFFGSATVTGNVVILKPYDASILSVGDHKLSTSLVEDYANLKSLTATNDFTVVEDKEGPKVVEATATLEKATITFNEDIDPETVTATDVYWLSGTTKKYAKTVTVSGGTKLVADFSNNPLPAYETTLYIDSVSDYSSNVNSTKEVKITATVDQTRPTVTDVKLATNKTDITVKFDKAVTAGDKKYFTLTDKDGKVVPVKAATATDTTNKTFKVSTYSALTAAGTYNLKVSGVQDKTALMNTMLDYNTTFTVGDTGNPTIQGISASNATRSVVITFSEKMDLASISNPANYLISLDTDGYAGAGVASLRTLPADVEVRPVQDGKAVLLVFPKQIGTTDVSFPTADTITSALNFGSVQSITVTGVKDAAGNILEGYTVPKPVVQKDASVVAYDTDDYGSSFAVQTDRKTIKVKFDQPIGTVSASDFTLSGAPTGVTITSAVSNGTNVVTLTTNANTGTSGVSVAVNEGNGIKTVAGNAVTPKTAFAAYDEVAPVTVVAENTSLVLANNTITLPFSEALKNTGSLAELYANDLVVKDLSKSNGTLTAGVNYTTAVSGSNLVITLIGQTLTSDFSVAVKDDAKYIQDNNGNLAEASTTYQTGNNTGVTPTGLTVTSGTNVITKLATLAIVGAATTGNTIKVYKDVNGDGLLDAGDTLDQTHTASASAYSSTVTLAPNAVNKYLVTETNGVAESAAIAVTITHDNLAPVAATEDGTADKEGTTQTADFNIVVNAENGAKVTATVGGANALKTVTDVTAAAAKATLPIDITKLASGANAIVITVTDAAGNVSATFTVNVTK